ncbi:MAG: serine/threonine-protein kinase, partial [Pirellula sp.]
MSQESPELPLDNRLLRPMDLIESDEPTSESELQLAAIVSNLTDQMQRGESVDIHRVCERFPDLASDLMQLWGTVLVTDAVGSAEADAAPNLSAIRPSKEWSLKLPCQMGDYELIQEIGRGGMGIVYLANQISLNREVAIKMILKDRLASDQEKLRFVAEARATAKLDHPGIVPVYDVGEIDDRPYFAMKYFRGKTLSELIVAEELGQRQVAAILEQVCRAVHFAHEFGIVHRDIKPSNILIDESGNAKLTDFGLAKQTDAAESLTRTGVVLGTPNYMSPEQARGRLGQIGPASDIYSLGSVLYHALTGKPPLVANSPVELMLKILEQDPTPPRIINPRIDRDLEMIVIRCLQKPPDLRYANAALLADDLRAFLHNEPVAARSGQFAQIIARWFRETHHAPVLENWGLLWMWHSLVLMILCLMTEALHWSGTHHRWYYALLWTVGMGTWASVFWALRRRMGPVTFVERQIAHVWGASMIGIGALFPIEWGLQLAPLKLTPLIAIIAGMVFLIKAGILSGVFYVQALCLFATSALMLAIPDFAHIIFGIVASTCFFVPGLKYYRQSLEQPASPIGSSRELHRNRILVP